jgi:hypothetical protein
MPQQRPKNCRLLPLLTNFGKKSLPLHRRRLKSIYFFALIFFTLTLATIFVSASFFVKGLKSEGERLKIEFWSSEMVKICRGQQNYRRCHCRHRLQRFVTMKKTV